MINIFKHLLPRARAWSITQSKQLRQFFEGLTGIGDDFKLFIDGVFGNIDPTVTTELDSWEAQFGLPGTLTVEADRRTRLDAAWKAVGGQSPRYTQDVLRDAGFDVYVHDWWVPGSEAAVNISAQATTRNPLTSLVAPSYPLVNIITSTKTSQVVLAGEAIAQAGEADAQAGNYIGFSTGRRVYTVPPNTALWPYFVYVGGATFGTLANVDAGRFDEFEALCLGLFPNHLWIGVMVNYV